MGKLFKGGTLFKGDAIDEKKVLTGDTIQGQGGTLIKEIRYLDFLQFMNSKKNSFRGNYKRKYGI